MSEIDRLLEGCTECEVCVQDCEFLKEACQSPKELAERFSAGYFKENPQVPYSCNLCNLCERLCPDELNIGKMCLEIRRQLVEEGLGPLPSHRFIKEEDKLVPLTNFKRPLESVGGMGQLKGEPYQQARRFVSQRWRFIEEDSGQSEPRPGSWESFFKRARTHYLTISCMPFQDVWSIDLERLKRCCTHIVTTHQRIVPLCAYYVTDTKGRRLPFVGG